MIIESKQRGRTIDTVKVIGVCPDHTDLQIARFAGYDSSHFGFHVERFEDEPERASVRLDKD